MAQEAVKAINLRIPETLHTELTSLAEDDLRSLQSEIIVLLRESVERRKILRRNRQDILQQLEDSSEEIEIALPVAA